MESRILRDRSLELIITVDCILLVAYWYFFTRGRTPVWRERCRRAFSPWLMSLCLVQTVLLSAGFSMIAKDIYSVYGSIPDPDGSSDLSYPWNTFSIVLGPTTFLGLLRLAWVTWSLRRLMYRSVILPRTRLRYFWWSHALFNMSGILSLFISCHVLPYEDDPQKATRVSLILAGFAITSFELGCGIWIYAVLHWKHCFVVSSTQRQQFERLNGLAPSTGTAIIVAIAQMVDEYD